jgi:DNA-binding NarL/FixJ family response regulator
VRGLDEKSAVILDRQPMWLAALDEILAGLGITVAGSALDGEEGLELVREHRPDLFVAGVDQASTDTLSHVRRVHEIHPTIRLVVLGDVADYSVIDEAFSAGVCVYCVKTADRDDLAAAIRQAFERSIYLAADTTDSLPRVSAAAHSPEHGLTRRELEVLRLTAEGYSNSHLARMLWVTEQTVKFHLSNIYRKLGVANRTEASRWAQLNGLLPAERGQDPDVAATRDEETGSDVEEMATRSSTKALTRA